MRCCEVFKDQDLQKHKVTNTQAIFAIYFFVGFVIIHAHAMSKRTASDANLNAANVQRNLARLMFNQSKVQVQTLCGRSERKTFIKTFDSGSLQDWATKLRVVQQANFCDALGAPTGSASPLSLYNCVSGSDPDKDQNNQSKMASFLNAGSDPNEENELHPKFGTSPVMEAAFHNHDEMLRVLIEHNGNLDTCSGIGWTALHYASQANNPKCVAILLAAGATISKNHKGKTALMRAVEQGKEDVVAVFNCLKE
tara:strand:+ start:99 stop:857 length:759 start_codon:yes stop_codon:yes gene_type:complete